MTIMKTVLLAIAGLCLFGGGIAYFSRSGPKPTNALSQPESGGATAAVEQAAPDGTESIGLRQQSAAAHRDGDGRATSRTPTALAANKAAPSLPFQQALDALVSSQTPFLQKQAAWQQLRDAGQLDQLIAEVEQRAGSNPTAPEYPATLGQAYLQKAGTLTDIREQGILGMKADQSFDAALNLEQSNWEAGFWKATAVAWISPSGTRHKPE